MNGDSKAALVAIDFVNELVDPQGKLAGKGYADFLSRHGTLDRVARLFGRVREAGLPLIHVRVGFSEDYREQPAQSPLFGPARKNGVFTLGAWGTEFHPKAAPLPGETVLVKHRVSAFHGTPLDLVLRNMGVAELLIAGVATDLAVQSAARDAHDRDYRVRVVGDCSGAATDRDHEDALRLLSKVASVENLDSLKKT
jgi:nicotinamidase-related amidase